VKELKEGKHNNLLCISYHNFWAILHEKLVRLSTYLKVLERTLLIEILEKMNVSN